MPPQVASDQKILAMARKAMARTGAQRGTRGAPALGPQGPVTVVSLLVVQVGIRRTARRTARRPAHRLALQTALRLRLRLRLRATGLGIRTACVR